MKDAMGRLASVVEEEKKKMAAVENKLFVMQRSVYHAQTWSVIAVGCMVTVVVMGRVKRLANPAAFSEEYPRCSTR